MAMQRSELEGLVQAALPGAVCRATDLTGGEDHWRLEVVWSGFAGLDLLEQHRRVMDILRPHLEQGGSGRLHAVQIQTVVPAETGRD